eukprot:m.95622 g.95622  ORF g.95622 m.95622 type:complete len:117 (+) comp15024_c0_seq4:665-1015(+)
MAMLCLLTWVFSLALITPATAERKNVLMILVDDLRPQMNAYGHSFMHTPNFDRLANTGLTFNRAYITYSYCSPSRNSFMTGRWPVSLSWKPIFFPASAQVLPILRLLQSPSVSLVP